MKVSRKLVERIVSQAVDVVEHDENLGCCLKCGAWCDGCEPDARMYPCDECGEYAVFGAEQILLELGSFAK
jgi:hypothetical protein